MNIASGLGVRQPPRVYIRCACGGAIDTYDHPDLKAHAVRVHNEIELHREWAARQPMSNTERSFEVRVR